LAGWYERNDFRQARRFYALTSRTVPGRSALNFQLDPFFTQWDFNYTTDIFQYHVHDRIEFDALTFNLGWKSLPQSHPTRQQWFCRGSRARRCLARLSLCIWPGQKRPKSKLNVTNLFDKDYISTIGTNGFGNIGDNQTLLNGAPRQIFATLKVGL
jgi:hypothetical protein